MVEKIKDLNGHPMFIDRRFNIIEMAVLPKLTYGLNVNEHYQNPR